MIPNLSLRAGKGKHPPPKKANDSKNATDTNTKPIPKPAVKADHSSSSTKQKTEEPAVAKKKQVDIDQKQEETAKSRDEKKTNVTPQETQLDPPKAKQSATVVITSNNKPSSSSKVSSSSSPIPLHLRVDPQCHAMSCLSNLSFKLAARAHSLHQSAKVESQVGKLKPIALGVENAIKILSAYHSDDNIEGDDSTEAMKTSSTASKKPSCRSFARERSRKLFTASKKLGKQIVKTSLHRPSLFNKKKSKKAASSKQATSTKKIDETSPVKPTTETSSNEKNNKPQQKQKKLSPEELKLQKFQAQMQQASSISGTTKRVRVLKHKKSKRQLYEVDRKALKKVFCLSCGRPKLEGCGFRVKTIQVKNKEGKKTQHTKKVLKCIFCSMLRRKANFKASQLMMKRKTRLMSGRVPSSSTKNQLKRILRRVNKMKTKRKIRNKLRKAKARGLFTVRGNKNVSLVSPLTEMNELKNWKKTNPTIKVRVRRVKDRRKRKAMKK